MEASQKIYHFGSGYLVGSYVLGGYQSLWVHENLTIF